MDHESPLPHNSTPPHSKFPWGEINTSPHSSLFSWLFSILPIFFFHYSVTRCHVCPDGTIWLYMAIPLHFSSSCVFIGLCVWLCLPVTAVSSTRCPSLSLTFHTHTFSAVSRPGKVVAVLCYSTTVGNIFNYAGNYVLESPFSYAWTHTIVCFA